MHWTSPIWLVQRTKVNHLGYEFIKVDHSRVSFVEGSKAKIHEFQIISPLGHTIAHSFELGLIQRSISIRVEESKVITNYCSYTFFSYY